MLRIHGYYRLLKDTAAVDRISRKKCFQVPEGTVLLVNGFQREGAMVEVIYEGTSLLMFEDDLLERTHPLEARSLFEKAIADDLPPKDL
jgi:hypothetical protein